MKEFDENILKLLKKEYSTKEVLGYMIYTFEEIQENNDMDTLLEYLVSNLVNVDKEMMKEKVESYLISNFYFYQHMNGKEALCFAFVTFYELSKTNKKITKEDIVIQLESLMKLYSVRTIFDAATYCLEKIKKDEENSNTSNNSEIPFIKK